MEAAAPREQMLNSLSLDGPQEFKDDFYDAMGLNLLFVRYKFYDSGKLDWPRDVYRPHMDMAVVAAHTAYLLAEDKPPEGSFAFYRKGMTDACLAQWLPPVSFEDPNNTWPGEVKSTFWRLMGKELEDKELDAKMCQQLLHYLLNKQIPAHYMPNPEQLPETASEFCLRAYEAAQESSEL